MKNITPRRLSVSSWSLHRTLGSLPFYGVGEAIPDATRGSQTLLQLPSQLNAFGIHTLEICHFHLASRDESYLRELRDALDENQIEVWSLLIDDGDLTHPENGERDLKWIVDWFSVAQTLGAKNVRVIAGKTRDETSLERSMEALRVLVAAAQTHGLRVMTENWFGVLDNPRDIIALLEEMRGEVGLCFDFGNWSGATKYDDLRQIAPLAESCHAKAHFVNENTVDVDDYTKCLDILREADFSGAFTLINGTPGDEWRGLALEREIVADYIK